LILLNQTKTFMEVAFLFFHHVGPVRITEYAEYTKFLTFNFMSKIFEIDVRLNILVN